VAVGWNSRTRPVCAEETQDNLRQKGGDSRRKVLKTDAQIAGQAVGPISGPINGPRGRPEVLDKGHRDLVAEVSASATLASCLGLGEQLFSSGAGQP